MMHLIDNYYIDTTGYGVTLQTATGKDKTESSYINRSDITAISNKP